MSIDQTSNLTGVNSSLFQEIDNSNTNNEDAPKKTLDKDDFMLLFITQLEYQDPLDPLDNNEMATQMALFNQVDQLYDINDNIEQLIDFSQDQEIANYSSLIGKEVKTESNIGRVENGEFLGGSISIQEPLTDAVLEIFSPDGDLINYIPLGSLAPGDYQIQWNAQNLDGEQVPDGNYQLVIDSNSGDEQNVTIETIGVITGAYIDDDGSYLILNDQQHITLDDIEEIHG